jgi:hypothetical protein
MPEDIPVPYCFRTPHRSAALSILFRAATRLAQSYFVDGQWTEAAHEAAWDMLWERFSEILVAERLHGNNAEVTPSRPGR